MGVKAEPMEYQPMGLLLLVTTALFTLMAAFKSHSVGHKQQEWSD
jgi:hypothetical protein